MIPLILIQEKGYMHQKDDTRSVIRANYQSNDKEKHHGEALDIIQQHLKLITINAIKTL